MGLVEQRPWLFDEDVRQNLLFARDTATDDDLLDVLDRVGLARGSPSAAGWMRRSANAARSSRAGRRSASRSPARCSPTSRCSCSTSRRRASIRGRADALLRDLTDAAARSGRTVVLISHTGAPAGLVDRTVTLDAGAVVEGDPARSGA